MHHTKGFAPCKELDSSSSDAVEETAAGGRGADSAPDAVDLG